MAPLIDLFTYEISSRLLRNQRLRHEKHSEVAVKRFVSNFRSKKALPRIPTLDIMREMKNPPRKKNVVVDLKIGLEKPLIIEKEGAKRRGRLFHAKRADLVFPQLPSWRPSGRTFSYFSESRTNSRGRDAELPKRNAHGQQLPELANDKRRHFAEHDHGLKLQQHSPHGSVDTVDTSVGSRSVRSSAASNVLLSRESSPPKPSPLAIQAPAPKEGLELPGIQLAKQRSSLHTDDRQPIQDTPKAARKAPVVMLRNQHLINRKKTETQEGTAIRLDNAKRFIKKKKPSTTARHVEFEMDLQNAVAPSADYRASIRRQRDECDELYEQFRLISPRVSHERLEAALVGLDDYLKPDLPEKEVSSVLYKEPTSFRRNTLLFKAMAGKAPPKSRPRPASCEQIREDAEPALLPRLKVSELIKSLD
ncbi:hypothetical protein HDU91_006017 [Kappamyces sp. JEL0680]|nr:hypothetical protein HDU91_006017 [Kappamyces sp. JEL0680]